LWLPMGRPEGPPLRKTQTALIERHYSKLHRLPSFHYIAKKPRVI